MIFRTRAGWCAGLLLLFSTAATATAEPRVKLRQKLEGHTVYLERDADGSHRYVTRDAEGRPLVLSPEAFAEKTYQARTESSGWARWTRSVLNISSPLGFYWVALGLAGQLLFTGRMLVQWLVSEKRKKSVVPVAFWWMSLGGASMLLVYFVWRKDIIGVLGQSTGWLIYSRNLYLIYFGHRAPRAAEDPGPEPELEA